MLRNVACGRTSAWPNNDMRPELQTFDGRLLCCVFLWLLYGLWVVGSLFFMGLWLVSGFCVTSAVLNAVSNDNWPTPLPFAVQLNILAMALYEGYHFVTRDSQHTWPFMRRIVRYVCHHFPYFRLNVVMFEEQEENDQKDGHLGAKAAIAVVEENKRPPCFESDKHALFAFHPHGVLSCGFSINGVHHLAFERAACRWISAKALFLFPIMRDVLHWMEFSNSTKESMQRIMRTGQNLCLLPGGIEEATLYQRGRHRVYIKKRFGFIKLALQHGYDIYPVYTFGEEYTYHAFTHLQWLRCQLNRFWVPGVIFFGNRLCFYLPRSDVDLITVVGKPLRLPHVETPSREVVKEYHDKYIEALQSLFDSYKGVYAVDPDAKLELF
ncbi:unnamed protein product [Peronospora destructor]|uniref:Acyltransferase n=1 Tax=Peronospora destructor TaxID=86335 RepID=A0AAV0UD99_9STRA|nr:unnamed protein product [Peronospora destructor]